MTNTSEVIILRGDFKKIVNRASKDLKNDNIFHACPDDLKYFEKCINDTKNSEVKLLSRNCRIYKTVCRVI